MPTIDRRTRTHFLHLKILSRPAVAFWYVDDHGAYDAEEGAGASAWHRAELPAWHHPVAAAPAH